MVEQLIKRRSFFPLIACLWMAAWSLAACDNGESSGSLPPDAVKLVPGVPAGPHEPSDSNPLGFIDSGVNADHPQLLGLVIAQKDFTGEGQGDSIGHGTLVVLSAVWGHFNTLNTLSPPAGADRRPPAIVMAKVIGRIPVDRSVLDARIDKAMNWLNSQNVEIINMSLDLR